MKTTLRIFSAVLLPFLVPIFIRNKQGTVREEYLDGVSLGIAVWAVFIIMVVPWILNLIF